MQLEKSRRRNFAGCRTFFELPKFKNKLGEQIEEPQDLLRDLEWESFAGEKFACTEREL